jgi:hypothetical protein
MRLCRERFFAQQTNADEMILNAAAIGVTQSQDSGCSLVQTAIQHTPTQRPRGNMLLKVFSDHLVP